MEEFTKYLQSKNLAKTTQKRYTKSVIKFIKWYKKDVINCAKKDILNYLSKHKTASSKSNTLQPLKHYFTYLKTQNLIAKNPTNFIKIRGLKRKHLYHIFKAEELTEIEDYYYQKYIKNFDYSKIPKSKKLNSKLSKERDYIVLQLFINQGLKIYEIAKINLEDIDLNKAQIYIKKARRSNARKLNLKATQIGSIMQYLQNIRPQLLANYKEENNQFILLLPENLNTKRNISYNYVNLIATLTKKLKSYPNFLNFKQIRASRITHWIKDKGLRNAQYFAGHRYISSTENYKINDLENLTKDIENLHPF